MVSLRNLSLAFIERGILPQFKMAFDTASNGNFMRKDVDKGEELRGGHDKTVRDGGGKDPNVREINEKLDDERESKGC